MLSGRLHEGRGDAAPREMVAPGGGSRRDRIRLTGRLLQHVRYGTEGTPSPGADGEPIQIAETRQVESYSCGHEIPGPQLDETATESGDLDAERRTSEETTDQP
jgi:hypothetical protein